MNLFSSSFHMMLQITSIVLIDASNESNTVVLDWNFMAVVYKYIGYVWAMITYLAAVFF